MDYNLSSALAYLWLSFCCFRVWIDNLSGIRVCGDDCPASWAKGKRPFGRSVVVGRMPQGRWMHFASPIRKRRDPASPSPIAPIRKGIGAGGAEISEGVPSYIGTPSDFSMLCISLSVCALHEQRIIHLMRYLTITLRPLMMLIPLHGAESFWPLML